MCQHNDGLKKDFCARDFLNGERQPWTDLLKSHGYMIPHIRVYTPQVITQTW
jgi:hypothetical protein